MSEPYSEQQVSLIINELTKQQYESITPEQYQLYLTPDTTDQDIADAVATHNTSNTAHADIRADIPDVIDNVLSTSTTDALSANQGKVLQDEITHLQGIGRFLALWNATTGLAETNPPVSPYTYKTGDYFIVGVVGATNYKPSGSSYTTGVASTTVETATIAVGNVYYYDGTTWKLQAGGGGGTITDVQVNGTSVVTSGVANIPVATNSDLGVIRANQSFGTYMSNGTMCTWKASDAEIVAKTQNYKPIVPSLVDKAVMEGLGNNSLTWTDTYKANARNTIGAGQTTVVFVDWVD